MTNVFFYRSGGFGERYRRPESGESPGEGLRTDESNVCTKLGQFCACLLMTALPVLLLGCEVKIYEGVDTEGQIRVTPDRILVAPTAVAVDSDDTASMRGESVDVTVIGLCKKNIPCESRHVYICLGKQCFDNVDQLGDTSTEATDTDTAEMQLAFSRWVTLSGTQTEDGRGCKNVSKEMVHCILTVDGSAQFKVLTSGMPYPYPGGIPMAVRSGPVKDEVGRIWIGYGLPEDTQLRILLADNTQIPMLTSLTPELGNYCNEVSGSCDDFARSLPFRLQLVQPVADTDSPGANDTEKDAAWANVSIDSPVLASASVAYVDDPDGKGKAWLSRDCTCDPYSKNKESSMSIRFSAELATSDKTCVCVNGVGGKVKLSADVTDYGSQSKILQMTNSVTLDVAPQLTRLVFEAAGVEISTDSADTDTDVTYGGDFSVTALNCQLDPMNDTDFSLTFEFEDVDKATFDDTAACPQQICTPDAEGQVVGTIQTADPTWGMYVQARGMNNRCLYTQAEVGGAK